jgi:hypothetical protein
MGMEKKPVVVSHEPGMLSINSSCDYYLEAVNPLPARTRNACDGVAARGNQGVPGMISTYPRVMLKTHYSP